MRNSMEFFFNYKHPVFYERGIRNLVQRWSEVMGNSGNYVDEDD